MRKTIAAISALAVMATGALAGPGPDEDTLMVEGEKTRFFIPSKLGYGNRSAGPIPAGSVLIFDVELLQINDKAQF